MAQSTPEDYVGNGQFTLPHFFLGRLSPPSGLPVFVDILLLETENCPS